MADKLIFLSHIHEERDLAVRIQNALRDEFGGFVEVFVSSDGSTIPAGANFLARIEDGLVRCAAAIYLISPKSVSRNWINFELGAVWIRNVISQRSGAQEIPAIPFCHSGSTPSQLPAPLNNLNGIVASESSQLQFAFRSLQAAMGGSGTLRTNFDALAVDVQAFQAEYTVGANLKKLFKLLGFEPITVAERLVTETSTIANMDFGFQSTETISAIRILEQGDLRGRITIRTDRSGTSFYGGGAVNGAELKVSAERALLLKYLR